MKLVSSICLVLALQFAVASRADAQVNATPEEVAVWDSSWEAYQALVAIPPADRGYATAVQDISIVINGDIDDVFDIYSNALNSLGLHPFLKSISVVRHTRTSVDFIAYEDIPLPDGSIFPGVTVAQQRFDRRHHTYDADTYDAPGIVTHQHITFTKVNRHQTLVTEHLSFDAPPELIELTAQGGVVAHQLVQVGIKQKIEAGELRPVRFPFWLPRTAPGHEPGSCDAD